MSSSHRLCRFARRRNVRKSRKNFAGVGNYNFCYFLYFCGTIKIGTIKYYPHEILIVPQSSALPLRSSKKYQEAFCFASYFETSTVSFAA